MKRNQSSDATFFHDEALLEWWSALTPMRWFGGERAEAHWRQCAPPHQRIPNQKIGRTDPLVFALVISLFFTIGCSRQNAERAPIAAAHQRHEHNPPHGGTPVVLGNEAYHLELVLNSAGGKLEAYVLDGEMENFIRIATSSLEIAAQVKGAPQTLVLQAAANPATGETMGDTALFEARADWLKTAREFEGTLKEITIRGTTFTNVKFNFPHGNDKD